MDGRAGLGEALRLDFNGTRVVPGSVEAGGWEGLGEELGRLETSLRHTVGTGVDAGLGQQGEVSQDGNNSE